METKKERWKRVLKNPRYIMLHLLNWKICRLIPDKIYLKLKYRLYMHQKLNLKNPRTFNEKLQWLKLHDRKPEYHQYVDKYEVRKHIKITIGEQYLIPLLGVYNSSSEIPWDNLPDKFVLKCTHGSHTNIICRDKKKLDINKACHDLNRWLKESCFWFGREWVYKNLASRIVCEQFIGENGKIPADYKVLCFGGKARLIEHHLDRFGEHHTQDFYDIKWNKTTISQGASFGGTSKLVSPKPRRLDEMIRLSEELAKGFRHIRIDWYLANEKLYFGEMTFFDSSGFDGFDNIEDDYLLGSWIELN